MELQKYIVTFNSGTPEKTSGFTPEEAIINATGKHLRKGHPNDFVSVFNRETGQTWNCGVEGGMGMTGLLKTVQVNPTAPAPAAV